MDEIEALFSKQKEISSEFAKEMAQLLYTKTRMTPELAASVNLKLARTVFSKWSIEILTVLYSVRAASYGDLKRNLKGVSSRVLSEKLKRLEAAKLVRRAVVDGRPPRTTYSLTEAGITVSRLGEPVFLYLGYKEGLYSAPEAAAPRNRW
ncbi:MAG TPA: helix-turn-helix domain-containing protein [Nitrososphaerales archaeon]|nr:helix-turn-helix domain-containing protein [Nitrososphaerales archaeon]